MPSTQTLTRPRRPEANGPLSPCCQDILVGTAILWCAHCGHTVPAAELDHEYHAPEVPR